MAELLVCRCGGEGCYTVLVWGLIQTWPRQLWNHKTTSQQATAPHLKTEYQMKQTPILPCLHHSNTLGESIWWIMKRFIFFSFFSDCTTLALLLFLFSLSPFLILYVIFNELLCAWSYTSTSFNLLLSLSLLSSFLAPPSLHRYCSFLFYHRSPRSLPYCLSLFNVHNSVVFRREPWW